MKFCTICKAILSLQTPIGKDEIIFECLGCKERYESTPEDTLIYSMDYKQQDNKSQYKFIKNIAHMDDNIKIKKKCKKCPEEYVRLAILGEDMIKYFGCSSCDFVWSE